MQMKHRFIKLARHGILLGMLFGCFAARASDFGPSEYQVKAEFLYNFAKFIKWPDNAFSQTNSPLVIGILGDDPFGPSLELALEGKMVDGHPLFVRDVDTLSDMRQCQVVFICKKPKRNIPRLLNTLQNLGILTVGETDSFLEAGGMISFVMEDSKVRFDINDSAATKAGLTISSKLLALARKRENLQ